MAKNCYLTEIAQMHFSGRSYNALEIVYVYILQRKNYNIAMTKNLHVVTFHYTFLMHNTNLNLYLYGL